MMKVSSLQEPNKTHSFGWTKQVIARAPNRTDLKQKFDGDSDDEEVAFSLPSAFATMETPIIGHSESPSDLPGLLGAKALERSRVVLDFRTLQLHMCGPEDIPLEKGLPTGTVTYQLERASTGHLMLPCTEFEKKHEHNTLKSTDLVPWARLGLLSVPTLSLRCRRQLGPWRRCLQPSGLSL